MLPPRAGTRAVSHPVAAFAPSSVPAATSPSAAKSQSPHTTSSTPRATPSTPYEVAFDGGVREVRGHRVAGAGAILWSIEPSTGIAALVAEAIVALPSVRCSQTAEAWGARAALDLLRQTSATRRCARVCGDNLAVVRFGAAHGRLRRPEVQCILEPALTAMCTAGWLLDWHAVRRRLNIAADTAATSALFWAARLADDGVQQRRVRVTWRHTSHLTPP